MPEYQWALGNGEIVTADYDRGSDALSNGQVHSELLDALRQFGHTVSCAPVNGWLPEVYQVTFQDGSQEDITICAKGTTPGGRANLKDEQRTQQKSQYINFTYERLQAGHRALQMGVYKRDGQTIFCAWKLKQSTADGDTPISKQIKITTIAQAMREGFVQQERGVGEYVCAFRREFIYFYIRNADWLHGAPVDELPEHDIPLPEEAEADNEAAFQAWFSRQVKDNGEPYSENTRRSYIAAIRAIPQVFAEQLAPYRSVFHIATTDVFDRVIGTVQSHEQFEAFNHSHGNGAAAPCLVLYRRFLSERPEPPVPVTFSTGLTSGYPRNRILFGAPGTGKSFTLNREKDALLAGGGEYERVTFHPDYSYAHFVGAYKPVPCKDSDGKDAITYSYVPGPFMRTYVKALRNGRTGDPKPFLLLIEEINRANAAAVFGDMFQLLDRGGDQVSEYPIQASNDVRKYLADELGGAPEEYAEIRLPDNLFLWATMNSADQGVFPLDTAFKRRWDFTYLGIDDGEAGIAGKKVVLGQGEHRRTVEWNALRRAVNRELLSYKVNEDKLMGPYFIAGKDLPEGEMMDAAEFTRIFKNKVIMYLFDDAAKQKRATLFGGCGEQARGQYSKICGEFDVKGVDIFCEGVSGRFLAGPPEDEAE